jgi:dTDP-4-amino-4,6-dideoxy-D-galactose acyltransferase
MSSLMLRGMGVIQILVGNGREPHETADIILDPLCADTSEKYFFGPRYLLPSVMEQIPAAEVAELLGMDEHELATEVAFNNAETELLDITGLVTKLEWDSGFFGYNVARISCQRLTATIEERIKQFVRENNIHLLQYLCNCHDRESVLVAERNGYNFVDIRLTFERHLKHPPVFPENGEFSLRKGKEEDIGSLKAFSSDIYRLSRYYFDTNFDRSKIEEFYLSWIEKAIYGTFDDYAYVLCRADRPVGFCTIKENALNTARIGLVGIDAEFAGKGLGRLMLEGTLHKIYETGIRYITVVTQGRNYGAQRLYQKCGFMTKSTHLWYHKWTG